MWLHNLFFILVGVTWLFGTAYAFAYGIQGTWRPENRYSTAILIASIISTAAIFATLITHIQH